MILGELSCCRHLSDATAEPRAAGHHALCPRFGLAILARRHAQVARRLERDADEAEVGPDPLLAEAHAHRAVLLEALGEAQTEARRLRAEIDGWREAERMAREDAAQLRAEVQRLRTVHRRVAALAHPISGEAPAEVVERLQAEDAAKARSGE